MAAIATSAALSASSIPWEGPVGTVKIGLKEDTFIVNPTYKELEDSDMELVVSGTKDAILMIENAAYEISEDKVFEAVSLAHKEIKKIIVSIEEFASAVGAKKEVLPKVAKNLEIEKKVK